MSERLEIPLSVDLEEILRVSEQAEEFLSEHGASLKAVFNVNLVLDELLTNVISYGFESLSADNGYIMVRIQVEGDELALEIEDDGRAFNPFDIDEPDLDLDIDDRPIGGLGIHFVRSMMNEVDYRREGNRNIITMRGSIH